MLSDKGAPDTFELWQGQDSGWALLFFLFVIQCRGQVMLVARDSISGEGGGEHFLYPET